MAWFFLSDLFYLYILQETILRYDAHIQMNRSYWIIVTRSVSPDLCPKIYPKRKLAITRSAMWFIHDQLIF